MLNNIDLRVGDCIELLDSVPDNSIDMVLTDPPYNISKENKFHTMGRRGIDFGEWDKGFDLFSYIEPLFRVCRNGANVVVFNDWKNIGDIAKYAESIGFEIKDMIRWRKSNPMPRNRDRRFVVDYETAVWLVKPGGRWVFNRISKSYDRPEYCGPAPSGKEKVNHPTQKPVWLMEGLIDNLSNKGDVVLDIFMGSGSTGVACMNKERNFIGFEMDGGYFKIARERMTNER